MNSRISSLFDMSGKTALITGASSGIGLQASRTLAMAGAQVILTARRTDRLEKAASEIRDGGASASWLKMDVSDPSSVESAFSEATGLCDRIDVVINNAGVAASGKAIDVSEEHWDEVISVNLKGAWMVAQQAGRCMSADGSGGSLINIASILGIGVMGGVAPYGAAKAGLDHLTRLLAYEWARFNIRVNAIAPGYLKTDMNRYFLDSPQGQRALSRIPQRRFGTTDELDGVMLLLASDASSYMTGSTIVVDGGHLQCSM